MAQSPYISTRGDEINQPCYDIDTETQRALVASDQTLEQALLVRHNKHIKTMGRHLLFEEVRLSFHLYAHYSEPHFMARNLLFNVTRSPEMLVFVWISSADSGNVTEQSSQSFSCTATTSILNRGSGGCADAATPATIRSRPSNSHTRTTHSQT